MPPAYVKPYVKSQKNDAADAEAICEAVTRPMMRFAEVKSIEQQSVLSIHRLRAQLIRHRTRLANTIRAHMAEFGIIAPVGRLGLERLIHVICDEADARVTPIVRRALGHLVNQHDQQVVQILDLDRQIMIWHRGNTTIRRLATIPGIGPLAASVLAATIGDASFSVRPCLSAWLGLVPRQSSSGREETRESRWQRCYRPAAIGPKKSLGLLSLNVRFMALNGHCLSALRLLWWAKAHRTIGGRWGPISHWCSPAEARVDQLFGWTSRHCCTASIACAAYITLGPAPI